MDALAITLSIIFGFIVLGLLAQLPLIVWAVIILFIIIGIFKK